MNHLLYHILTYTSLRTCSLSYILLYSKPNMVKWFKEKPRDDTFLFMVCMTPNNLLLSSSFKPWWPSWPTSPRTPLLVFSPYYNYEYMSSMMRWLPCTCLITFLNSSLWFLQVGRMILASYKKFLSFSLLESSWPRVCSLLAILILLVTCLFLS